MIQIKQLQLELPLPEEWEYILRASFTTATGWTVYAKDYGKKAFRIPVKIGRPPREEQERPT